MMHKFIILFVVLSISVFPQEKEISKKKTELNDIKNEIEVLENQLKKKTKKERESFEAIDNYNKQSFLLNKIINKLRSEEKEKEKQINFTENKIIRTENDIKDLQDRYSRYITNIYKHGKPSELESLLNANSLKQAVLRYKYLQKFSEKRQRDLQKLVEKRKLLKNLKIKLIAEKKEKEQLAAQKLQEERALQNKLVERRRILIGIRNDKEELKKEIQANKAAQAQIQNLIAKLIRDVEKRKEEERLRREQLRLERERLLTEKSKKNDYEHKPEVIPEKYDVNLSTDDFSSFSALKGKLIWPVSGGKIYKKFGKQHNEKLNTITLNYGIDIKAGKDINVKAVAEGVVSAIDYIPGYGSVIIVSHKNDYRTVYSHLGQIYVNEGDKVNRATVIATIGESIEGNILHFEIWNSRNNQNPEYWLAKK